MTVQGAAFVTNALDPYHDLDVRLDGMPDRNVSKVIVQKIDKSLTITSPFGAGVEWDCHIFTLPELESFVGIASPGSSVTGLAVTPQEAFGGGEFFQIDNFTVGNANGIPIAPFVIAMVPTGLNTLPNGSAQATAVQYLTLDISEYFSGQKRLIAGAFEVHDVTSELNKQGSVCVYRQPTTNNIVQINDQFVGGGGTYSTASTGIATISRSPPCNLSDAIILGGSRQWSSRDGCYVVMTQDTTRNDLCGSFIGGRKFSYGDDVITLSSTIANPDFYGFGTFYQSLAGAGVLGVDWARGIGWKPTPFHISGAYFTGLNPASALTLNIRMILESAPTPENRQLVVLAQNPPDEDPIALEIYQRASAMLLPGCPVDDNASGDFWDNVLGFLDTAAKFVVPMLPIPGASMLGNLASKGINAGRKMRNDRDDKKKQEALSKAKDKRQLPAKKELALQKKK